MNHDPSELVRARLSPLIRRMAAGEDVPPAQWYRAEGFLEMLLASGVVDPAQLGELIDLQYHEVLGPQASALGGEPARSWVIDGAAVRLRFRLPRAPVYPTGGS